MGTRYWPLYKPLYKPTNSEDGRRTVRRLSEKAPPPGTMQPRCCRLKWGWVSNLHTSTHTNMFIACCFKIRQVAIFGIGIMILTWFFGRQFFNQIRNRRAVERGSASVKLCLKGPRDTKGGRYTTNITCHPHLKAKYLFITAEPRNLTNQSCCCSDIGSLCSRQFQISI